MDQAQLDLLRIQRDRAQTAYAHTKQRAATGHATQRELERARSAYIAAQSELRAALTVAKAAQGWIAR